jgi:glutamine amidotransferase
LEVAIINYGMGNIASVEKAIKFLGYDPVVTNCHDEIRKSAYIILPGVGAFAQGMKNLKDLNLIQILNQEVLVNKKPFLGICLGMQLIASKGYEIEETDGLDWIKGEVIKINEPDRSIPHLGWNEIKVLNSSFIEKFNKKDFYFIHSYHLSLQSQEDVAATVNYGSDYVAAIQKNNIFATQFHPEKSQTAGLELINKFFNFYA